MNHVSVCPVVSDPCGSRNRSTTLQKLHVLAWLQRRNVSKESAVRGSRQVKFLYTWKVWTEVCYQLQPPKAAKTQGQAKPLWMKVTGRKKGPELYESSQPIWRTSEQWPPGKA